MQFASLAVSVLVAVSAAQESGEPVKQPLSVLYAGCPETPREQAFVGFLGQNFASVESIDLERLAGADVKRFDVVVADWKSRYRRNADGKSDYDSASGHQSHLGTDFTKPVVMIGAVGGELARWSKIGWM